MANIRDAELIAIRDLRNFEHTMRQDRWAGGTLRGGFPVYPSRDALPTADVGLAYATVVLRGIPDIVYVCIRDGSGTWTWTEIGTFTDTSVAYNVKAYGAIGDGSANDTTAIQNAINAANSGGGGEVLFPEGTYMTNKLTLYSKVWLTGEGPQVSVLKLRNSQNTALLTTNGFVTTDTAGGIYAFGLQGLTFDGNKANQASNSDSGCVQLYGYNYVIRDVHIRNAESVGLYTNYESGASAPGPDGMSMEANVFNLAVWESGTDGVYWNGPHDSMWSHCIAFENADRGFRVETRGNALIAQGCHSWGNTQDYAWYLNGTGCHLMGCTGEGASVNQVWIGQNDIAIVGGVYFAAGGGGDGINFGNAVGGIYIATKLLNFTTAAVALGANDAGGNSLDLLVYSPSGAAITGTLHESTKLNCMTTGGATEKMSQLKGLALIGELRLKDGITAPATLSGFASIYVDGSDGDLKVKFGDGTVKTIVVDT